MVEAIISTGAVILYSGRNFAAGVRLLVKSFAEMVMAASMRGEKNPCRRALQLTLPQVKKRSLRFDITILFVSLHD